MASLFEQLGAVHWDDLEGHTTRESGLFEYANSKLMVIMMGRELNKRLKVLPHPHSCWQPVMQDVCPCPFSCSLVALVLLNLLDSVSQNIMMSS